MLEEDSLKTIISKTKTTPPYCPRIVFDILFLSIFLLLIEFIYIFVLAEILSSYDNNNQI